MTYNLKHYIQQKGHFNPYGTPVCSAIDDDITFFNCEVGDLSGRDGNVVRDYNGGYSADFSVASCERGCDSRYIPFYLYMYI